MTRAISLAALAVVFTGVVACKGFSPAEGSSAGEKAYNRSCIVCHGKNGGGADGPSLLERPLTRARIQDQIRRGGNGMQPFEGRLSPDEIAQAADWVVELRKRAGKTTPD